MSVFKRGELSDAEARLQEEVKSFLEDKTRSQDLVVGLEAENKTLQSAKTKLEQEREQQLAKLSLALSNAKKKEQEVTLSLCKKRLADSRSTLH